MVAVAIAGTFGATWAWQGRHAAAVPHGIVVGNGRLEAIQVDVATKFAGRIAEVLFDEGDRVQAGQVVARMDTDSLRAQLREAQAQVDNARSAKLTAVAVVSERQTATATADALAGVAVYVFSLTSLGIFLGTVSRSMPQFSLIALPVYMVMIMLSGGHTPMESMPVPMQRIMQLSPAMHFMRIAQAILYRGADLAIVWRDFAATAGLGAVFFLAALWRFRRTLVT